MGVTFFCLVYSIGAQALEGSKQLAALQQSLDAAYARLNQPVVELNSSYTKALARLFKETSSKGQLEGALQVKAEMDAFGDGERFNAVGFVKRSTRNQGLEKLRGKYLKQRELITAGSEQASLELLAKYRAALMMIEEEQTKQEQLEVALAARKLRLALARDPRFAGVKDSFVAAKPFAGRIHFVAKGEIEFRFAGSKLYFRNKSDNPQYVEGVTRTRDFRAGDIIFFKMRSTSVFRYLIIALESDDGSVSAGVGAKDYRYLAANVDGDKLDSAAILAIRDLPQAGGSGDANMISLWQNHELSEEARADSEWIKIAPSADWHHYAIVIRPEMLKKTKNGKK